MKRNKKRIIAAVAVICALAAGGAGVLDQRGAVGSTIDRDHPSLAGVDETDIPRALATCVAADIVVRFTN